MFDVDGPRARPFRAQCMPRSRYAPEATNLPRLCTQLSRLNPAKTCVNRVAVRRVPLLLGASVLCFALHSAAQEKSGGNRAAAEALFNQGRDLMSAGKFSEACPKFEASQQLDPGL